MSGAERTNDQIADDVFHALHPECPAFPGVANACSPQVCDCFNCEQLPEKVAELVTALAPFAHAAEYWDRNEKFAAQQVGVNRSDLGRARAALARLQDVNISDIIGPHDP